MKAHSPTTAVANETSDLLVGIPSCPDVGYIRKHVLIEDVARELGIEIFGGHRARCWRPDNHAHGDADPSVRFHLRKNRVRCFVCDLVRGMSNLDLVMGVLGCGFPSAIHWICERFPVPSAMRGSPVGPRSRWPDTYRVGVTGFALEIIVRSLLWATLTPTQRTVLVVLLTFRDGESGLTHISYRGMMRFGGVRSQTSVSRAIHNLRRLHALEVLHSPGVGIVRGCNSYRLTLEDARFIKLMNDIHHNQRQEIEQERVFRAEARAARRRAEREEWNGR